MVWYIYHIIIAYYNLCYMNYVICYIIPYHIKLNYIELFFYYCHSHKYFLFVCVTFRMLTYGTVCTVGWQFCLQMLVYLPPSISSSSLEILLGYGNLLHPHIYLYYSSKINLLETLIFHGVFFEGEVIRATPKSGQGLLLPSTFSGWCQVYKHETFFSFFEYSQ